MTKRILVTDEDGHVTEVEVTGQLWALLFGDDAGTLRKVAVDASGRVRIALE